MRENHFNDDEIKECLVSYVSYPMNDLFGILAAGVIAAALIGGGVAFRPELSRYHTQLDLGNARFSIYYFRPDGSGWFKGWGYQHGSVTSEYDVFSACNAKDKQRVNQVFTENGHVTGRSTFTLSCTQIKSIFPR